MNMMKMMVAAALSAGALSASGADGESAKFESKYYKDWPMFSTYARETEEKQPIEHHPRSVNYERAREKQILERQGEVLLLRGWKSLKFGARSPRV